MIPLLTPVIFHETVPLSNGHNNDITFYYYKRASEQYKFKISEPKLGHFPNAEFVSRKVIPSVSSAIFVTTRTFQVGKQEKISNFMGSTLEKGASCMLGGNMEFGMFSFNIKILT